MMKEKIWVSAIVLVIEFKNQSDENAVENNEDKADKINNEKIDTETRKA